MASAMTTASRISGVAPLAVHFDAVDSGNGIVQPALEGGRREYADQHYEWGFDDENAGTWDKTDGASRNAAIGYVAAHVFETPGEFTVTLRVTELNGDITDYEETITVTDPDTVFSGITFYVANAPTGSDAANGTSPSTPYETFAKAMAEADTSCRILFNRGDTFTTSTDGDITGVGPGLIGAYGTGADPIITQTADAKSAFVLDTSASDWRITNLALTGSGADSAGKGFCGGSDAYTHDKLTVIGVTVSGFKQALHTTYEPVATRGANPHDHMIFADMDFSDNGSSAGGNGTWWGGTRLALLGCLNDDVISGGEHNVRIWHAQKSVISHCELTNANEGKHAVKLHNNVLVTNLPDGKYNVISDNYGHGGTNTFAIGAQSDAHAETLTDCVAERNLVVGDATTSIGIWLGGPCMTGRNNVWVNNHTAADKWGVGIAKSGAGPAVDGCRAVNNTSYRAVADALRSFCVRVSNGSDIVASNNLATTAGSGTADAVRDDSGNATQQTNYDDCPVAELTDPANNDFTLVAGSSAINTATTLAYVRDDYVGTSRPQGGSHDIGAYEFLTGGDTDPPTITAISHEDGSYITDAAINLDITFSEPIVTPTANSIALTGLAAANALVAAPADQGGNKWRWAITVLQSGALNINVGPAPDTIEDLSENDLVAVDYDYAVDLIAPTVVSIDPADTATITEADIEVDVNFSETVTGVEAGDLELSNTASDSGAAVDSVENTSGNIYRFSISGLVDGPLDLSLAPDAGDIQDTAGNDLANETWSYTVSIVSDTTKPTILTISPAPSATITSSSQAITVTFSEAVQNVDATDMVLSGSAKGVDTAVGTPRQGATGAIWNFPLTDLVSGNLNIALAPDAGDITDLADNDLAPNAWSYTVTIPAPIPESSIVEQAVYAILDGNAGVTALVAGRVHLNFIPQNDPLPAIVINRVGIDHLHDMSGSSGLATARIAVDYFSSGRRASRTLAEAGRQALQGKYGSHGGVTVQGVFLDGDSADSEIVERGGGMQMVHVVTHEYDIAYEEAIPA